MISKSKCYNFYLLRSAELALAHDYKYFIILDTEEYTRKSTYTEPAKIKGSSTTSGNTTTFKATYYESETTTYYKPSTKLTIKCFKNKPKPFELPTINHPIGDAKYLVEKIRKTYNISKHKMNKSPKF